MRASRVRRNLLVLPQKRIQIISVNNQIAPYVGQTSVAIEGENFGRDTGAVTYNGHPVTVNSWNGTTINVTWPDLPFDSVYSDTRLTTNYLLVIRRADNATQTTQRDTVKAPGDIYKFITSVGPGGIFENDPNVNLGQGSFYWRTLTGSLVDVTSDGYPQGIQQTGSNPDVTGKYAIWDGAWSNTANVSISG